MDKRTKLYNELYVLEYVKCYGRFTVFWATHHIRRASAVDKMIKLGYIESVDSETDYFPWSSYKITSDGLNYLNSFYEKYPEYIDMIKEQDK